MRFGGRRSFLRLVMTSAGKSEQAGRAVLLETAQPLADGGHGGGEETRGGLDAALLGAFDEAQAMVVGVVFQFTHQIEITGGGSHEKRILSAAPPPPWLWKSGIPQTTWDPTFPQPQQQAPLTSCAPSKPPTPNAAFRSNTSTPRGGYDVSRLSHRGISLDKSVISVIMVPR